MPIPVYVINLDMRSDRMARMSERLEGIGHVRVSAVSGHQLVDWPACIDLPAGSTLNRFEYACAQSHLKAATEVVKQNHPYACILEDDVLLSADFHKFIESTQWIPEAAELIKCETMGTRVWISRNGVAAMDRSLFALKSFHPGTAGYFISQRGAQKLVRLLSHSLLAVDDQIFDQALQGKVFGEIWQLAPAICMQEFIAAGGSEDSDIAQYRECARSATRKRRSAMRKLIKEVCRPLTQLRNIKRWITQRRVRVPLG